MYALDDGRPTNDEQLLSALEEKHQLIRDRVCGVAMGYDNGFYLWGEGGTSKSYTVEETLKKLRKPYKLSNSRITGKGLFQLLKDFPDTIHVLEDVETLFREQNAVGVLRSALWGQVDATGRQERTVVWQTGLERDEFDFTGGIIITANCGLDDIPRLRALKTRIPYLRYQPTTGEIAALMRKIARGGYSHGEYRLEPAKCQEVAEFIISRCQRVQRNLDLRLLVNGFKDRLQYENGEAETHWEDLLESRMKERVIQPTGRRAEQKATELEVVRRIAHLPPQERLEAWEKETGKSQAALYRRLGELKRGASHFLTSA
jgi:hypothetical protein